MNVRVLKAGQQRDMVGEWRSMKSNPYLAEIPSLANLGEGKDFSRNKKIQGGGGGGEGGFRAYSL